MQSFFHAQELLRQVIVLSRYIALVSDKMVGWFMVVNATFNNISVISWWSVLLVEET